MKQAPPDTSLSNELRARKSRDELLNVDRERRAECGLDVVTRSKQDWQRQTRRPVAFSARDALVVLEFEATLVAMAAGSLASGFELTEGDHDRLRLAYTRICTIVNEVNR